MKNCEDNIFTMPTICMICCYFGKLPSTFQLWLNTCEYNETVDFIVFTDDERRFDVPDNVRIIYIDFEELKEKIQSIFDFPIALDRPYKLCDFKPAYGEIFYEYIESYDFWGHCDLDMFFGDIRKFITEDILGQYDKILTAGHLTLYRNGDANSWYRTLTTNKYQNWKTVYQTTDSCAFDEWAGHCGGGMSFICEENGVKQYNANVMADVNFLKYHYEINLAEPVKAIFVWKEGKLFAVYEDKTGLTNKEYLYLHVAKRKFVIKGKENKKSFAITPPHNIIDLPEKLDENCFQNLLHYHGLYLEPIIFLWGRMKVKLKKCMYKNFEGSS